MESMTMTKTFAFFDILNQKNRTNASPHGHPFVPSCCRTLFYSHLIAFGTESLSGSVRVIDLFLVTQIVLLWETSSLPLVTLQASADREGKRAVHENESRCPQLWDCCAVHFPTQVKHSVGVRTAEAEGKRIHRQSEWRNNAIRSVTFCSSTKCLS